MLTETVVRLRAAETSVDPYSKKPKADWTKAPDELPITTLAPAEPRPSEEPVQEARNAVISGWTLYLPLGADITERDRVRVRGEVYAVLGRPADWQDRGLVVQTTRTDG